MPKVSFADEKTKDEKLTDEKLKVRKTSSSSPTSSTPTAKSSFDQQIGKENNDNSESISYAILLYLKIFLSGMADAFSFVPPIVAIYKSQSIRNNTLKCVILNGLIFLGGIFIFNNFLNGTLKSMQMRFLQDMDKQSLEGIMDVYDKILASLYYLLWVYPMYVLSFIISMLWHQEIADESYKLIHKVIKTPKLNYNKILKRIGEDMYRFLLNFCFLIEISLISLIPVVGPPIGFLHLCWLYSFYCFEFKWINFGWSLKERIEFIEDHWAYFAGFGFPFTMFTFFFPQVIGSGIFGMLFPLYIIMSNEASPLPKEVNRKAPLSNLPMFTVAKYVLKLVFMKFDK